MVDSAVYGCAESSGVGRHWRTEVALSAKGTEPLCTQSLAYLLHFYLASNTWRGVLICGDICMSQCYSQYEQLLHTGVLRRGVVGTGSAHASRFHGVEH